MKDRSVFSPPHRLQRVRANAARYPWAAELRQRLVDAAQPWMARTDQELWEAMFGPGTTRSWMVWSDGHCPACLQGVPMYNWQVDAFARPWKVRCPLCQELFPKNDYLPFYRSGLDEDGAFHLDRADRSLLYNTEHPDPADPRRAFGVDDGEGYAEGDRRWRFIGAYLIYGQWKQVVLGGIRRLSDAYAATGQPLYAHKAGVLLARVAEVVLFPLCQDGSEGRNPPAGVVTLPPVGAAPG